MEDKFELLAKQIFNSLDNHVDGNGKIGSIANALRQAHKDGFKEGFSEGLGKALDCVNLGKQTRELR